MKWDKFIQEYNDLTSLVFYHLYDMTDNENQKLTIFKYAFRRRFKMTLFDKSNAIASILESHKSLNILDNITDMEIYNQDFKIYFLVAKTMLGLNNELPEILCFSIEDGDDVVYFDLFVEKDKDEDYDPVFITTETEDNIMEYNDSLEILFPALIELAYYKLKERMFN